MAQSYEDMDAIAMLKADHRKVEDIFEQFESASGKGKKQKLAEQVCLELKVHTLIEEEIFYPACRGAEVEDDLIDEAYVEHDAAKVLIAVIEQGGPDEAFYDAQVKVLSEMIEHHVEEEEKRAEGMFAQARAAGLDMDDLADRMRARKQTATREYQAGAMAEPRTFAGGDAESAKAEEPFDGSSATRDEDPPALR